MKCSVSTCKSEVGRLRLEIFQPIRITIPICNQCASRATGVITATVETDTPKQIREMPILVCYPLEAKEFWYTVSADDTAQELTEQAEKDMEILCECRLMYKGKDLDPTATLSDVVKAGDTVTLRVQA